MDNYQLFLLQFGKLKIRLVLKPSLFRSLNYMKESVTTTILLDHISSMEWPIKKKKKKSRIQDFFHRKRTKMVLANDPPFYSFRFFIIPISTTGYARDWGSGDQIS
jgi:hypothetical protein